MVSQLEITSWMLHIVTYLSIRASMIVFDEGDESVIKNGDVN